MTEREAEVLAALLAKDPGRPNGEGLAPMDFGGKDASHHAVTAKRMVAKGWVQRRFRGYAWDGEQPPLTHRRGSCVYRATAKGRQALANHQLMAQADA